MEEHLHSYNCFGVYSSDNCVFQSDSDDVQSPVHSTPCASYSSGSLPLLRWIICNTHSSLFDCCWFPNDFGRHSPAPIINMLDCLHSSHGEANRRSACIFNTSFIVKCFYTTLAWTSPTGGSWSFTVVEGIYAQISSDSWDGSLFSSLLLHCWSGHCLLPCDASLGFDKSLMISCEFWNTADVCISIASLWT